MPISHLNITDFRNLTSINIDPLPTGFNLLYGNNGSGKTSILEALYYLSLARSFRTSTLNKVIRHQTEKFRIFAHSQLNDAQHAPIGVERALNGELKIRIAGKDAKGTAELAQMTPVQLIHSHCFNLLEGGPSFRRKYLDWGVFYLKNECWVAWRDFVQALKQRNAALRAQRPKREIESWSQELVQKALIFDGLRKEYVKILLPELKKAVSRLLPIPDLKMHYYAGWDETQHYQDILADSIDKDLHLGHTQFGPHRADLKITINKVTAKDILSRGQQKLFVCAMILAQGAILKSDANKAPIYLIDDLPAELDTVSRTNLIALLSEQDTQVFVTAVEREALSGVLFGLPLRMFHVEHGNVTEARELPENSMNV